MAGDAGAWFEATKREAGLAPMECGVCWHVYDPAEGCDHWQIDPGVAFIDLPDHWTCPKCGHPQDKFVPKATPLDEAVEKVMDHYTTAAANMADLPIYNKKLGLGAYGFRVYEDSYFGLVATPWCLNMIMMPREEGQWADLNQGDEVDKTLPCGDFGFTVAHFDSLGTVLTCSLFSPMQDFHSPEDVKIAAEAALGELFPEPKPQEVDRRALLRGSFKAS